MKISILGTGVVGQMIAEKLLALGHHVFMGTRNVQNTLTREKIEPRIKLNFKQWAESLHNLKITEFEALPNDSDLFLNATSGQVSLQVLQILGEDKIRGKILIDLANTLDFSKGMPPSLSICNTDSLGETIQRTFPETKVVKTFNTMNCEVMVNPERVSGDHSIFLSGNDMEAKAIVKRLLEDIGWKPRNIIDLGDIKTSRGTEMLLPLWISLRGKLGTGDFNFQIKRN